MRKNLDHPVPIKRADLAPRVRVRRWAIIYAVNEWERSDRNIEFVNPSEFEFEDVRICHELTTATEHRGLLFVWAYMGKVDHRLNQGR